MQGDKQSDILAEIQINYEKDGNSRNESKVNRRTQCIDLSVDQTHHNLVLMVLSIL